MGLEERLEESFDGGETPKQLQLGLDVGHRLVKTRIRPLSKVAE